MPYRTITEGKVTLHIPVARIPEEGEVFYNPVMGFDRNISVAAFALAPKILERHDVCVCDLLSASGVRAIRYAKESMLKTVTANDISKRATNLISMNAKRNKTRIKITNLSANALLTREHFDVIDIDPFGSPITFVESAAYSIPFRGVLACTATDLGPLMGAYPEVSLRRYGLRSLETDYSKELGVRILITAIMRKCFALEKTFIPLLSYTRKHYIRVYGNVRYGNKNVNRTLRDFGYVSHCSKCGWRKAELVLQCPLCKSKTEFCGELYLGDIQNQEFCRAVVENLWEREFTEAHFVKTLYDEPPFPFYYDTHYISEKQKSSPLPVETIIERLREEGFRAGRTHFSGTAVKTNAPFEDVVRLASRENNQSSSKKGT